MTDIQLELQQPMKNLLHSSMPMSTVKDISKQGNMAHSGRPPKHVKYKEYLERLGSFVAWPIRYVPKTPEELSTAGFFYIGSADRVTCFQCGITLRDWEADHNAIEEHRRYSAECEFINRSDMSQLGVTERNSASGHLPSGASVTETSGVSTSGKEGMMKTVMSDLVTTETSHTSDLPSLLTENKRLKEQRVCRVCRTKEAAILFLPCGHLVTCPGCADTMSDCVVCGRNIVGTVKTYLS